MAVTLGKRYRFPAAPVQVEGQEKIPDVPHVSVLCIKPGQCDLRLDDNPMSEDKPNVLPSAD